MRKIISLAAAILVSQYCFTSSSVSSAVRAKDIDIPSQLASIKETFDLPGVSSGSPRVIIHIQDAHCNYEAQKNLAGVLENLIKNYNLKLVLVEGGSGDVSLSFLRGYGDAKTRAEIADKYLQAGKISGEEYLDIVSDYDLELYGIDDEDLYDKHLASFWKIDVIKAEGLKHLETVMSVVAKLKPFMLSDELRRLEQKISDYESKTFSLADYCRFLKEEAEKKGINMQGYSSLADFSETARLENSLDFQKVETERNAFIKELANQMGETGVKDLIQKTEEFKNQKMTQQEYYSFLKTIAEQKIDMAAAYPSLNDYITYLNVSKNINAQKLLKDVAAVEGALRSVLLENDEQKKLSEIDRMVRILMKFFNLEVTPEDYAYFKDNKDKFTDSYWMGFLMDCCTRYNVAMNVEMSSVVNDNLAFLEDFYKLGVAREDAFIKNLAGKMEESGENIAVLITGGFHTPGVTRMLKEKGYSYMVATPVITREGDSSVYFAVLREQGIGTTEGLYTTDTDE